MNNKLFSIVVILTMIATAFFYTGGAKQSFVVGEALAETTSLYAEAGISAYANIGPIDDLDEFKEAFLTIEYEVPGTFFIGTLDMPVYEPIYNPFVLVHKADWIVAFYPNTDPASKMVDVIGRNLEETLLEKAVKIVGGASVEEIFHYDFRYSGATNLLLIAEYQADGNTFTLDVPSTNVDEKSYAFYRTYEPSFTLDNEMIDQVNFVLTNADYASGLVYGTIYGHFGPEPLIDIPTDITNTFTVWNRDFYAFGALALYGGADDFTYADQDYLREIALTAPSGLPDVAFDLTPSAFGKVSPDVGATDVLLNPILSWGTSTAPNYQYCIDTSAPDENPLTDDCNTKWVSTGSATSVALSNLFFDTTYYWQVKAVNSAGEIFANDGDWWSFTTPERVDPGYFAKVGETLSQPIDSLSKVTMT